MTVTWKLSEVDIKQALVQWLESEHDITVYPAQIQLIIYGNPGNQAVKAEATGVVDGVSLGPYR